MKGIWYGKATGRCGCHRMGDTVAPVRTGKAAASRLKTLPREFLDNTGNAILFPAVADRIGESLVRSAPVSAWEGC